MIFSGFGDESEIKECARTLNKPLKINNTEYFSSIFMGIAEYRGDNSKVIRDANTALKFAIKNLRRYYIYTDDMRTQTDEHLKLSGEIMRAIRKKEFFLAYHSKIDISTGAIEGAEVLLRWLHPEKGLIPPGKFIPYIERTTLIYEITQYILRGSFI